MKKYIQCSFKKDNVRTHGWIEERGAKLGYMVEIEGEFWEVIGVGSSYQTRDQVDAVGRAKMPSIN